MYRCLGADNIKKSLWTHFMYLIHFKTRRYYDLLLPECELNFVDYCFTFKLIPDLERIEVLTTHCGVRQSTPSDQVEWQDGLL